MAIFQNADPFDQPFRPEVERRGLLHPFSSFQDDELAAIVEATRAVGDAGFFLSVTEAMSMEPDYIPPPEWEPRHWWIPLSDIGRYYDVDRTHGWEVAAYSQRGTWGMLCSHEQYGLVGGSPTFIDTLYQHLWALEPEQVREFLESWRDMNEAWGSRVDWVPRILSDVYGTEEAKVLLARVSWPADPKQWIGRYPDV